MGDEAIHFNLNKSPKQSECESTHCKTVETIIPMSPELIFCCNFHNSINEKEMNFKYLEDLDCEFFISSFDLKETVLSLNENSTEKSSSTKEKVIEIETSSEGLILKELPIEVGFLRTKKRKKCDYISCID